MAIMKPRFSEYIRNVMVTGTGIAIAQAIPIAVTPLLTRLYTPTQFGVFAVFMALVSILTAVATGRYEIAIVMPGSHRRAQTVLLLSLFVSLTSMSIVLVIIGIAWIFIPDTTLSEITVISDLGFLVFGVPFLAHLNAVQQSLTIWSNRLKEFRRVALSRFVQAATTAVLSIMVVNFSVIGGNGLIMGAALGSIAGICMLLPGLVGMPTSFWRMARYRPLMREARTYINYPKYSVISSLANALAWRLPMIAFPALFGMATTGQLSIAYRIVGLPSRMVGRAFLDVFRQKAAEDFARDGNCFAIYMKTFKILASLSVVLFLPLVLFGGDLFALVFGPEWRVSGEFVQVLAVMFAAGFIASPLAFVLYVANRQSWDMAWQFLFASATAIALVIGAWTGLAEVTVMSLAALGLISYSIYFGVSYRTASQGASRGASGVERNLG